MQGGEHTCFDGNDGPCLMMVVRPSSPCLHVLASKTFWKFKLIRCQLFIQIRTTNLDDINSFCKFIVIKILQFTMMMIFWWFYLCGLASIVCCKEWWWILSSSFNQFGHPCTLEDIGGGGDGGILGEEGARGGGG